MSGTDRGQTTFDFAVGITLFLLVVAFAFISVPGFIAPYQGGEASETLLADRAASQLATDELAAPGERYALDPDRIDAFFGAADPAAALGVGDYDLNVTLTALNGTEPAFENRSVGESPSGNAAVSRSRRVVSVPGESGRVWADLTVRVWE